MNAIISSARLAIEIEVGAGSSLLRSVIPGVTIKDIVWSPGLSAVVDALNLPFSENSVGTIFGVNCFHHFPDPYSFLDEVGRVCQPGGDVILIEPYYGPVASLIYKRLFESEDFDKEASLVSSTKGPMSAANQALSYIVFVREYAEFRRRYPSLELVHAEPLSNYLRYIVSGGVNFRQLLPNVLIPVLKGIETVFQPVRKWFALHQVIVIRKRST